MTRRGALRTMAAASGGIGAMVGAHTERVGAEAAVATTASGPFVDVLDHGATGDGATDDTAAIRTAIDALGGRGGCVWFPPGTYLLTDSLVVDYATTLLGANPAASILRMSAAVSSDMIVGGPSFPVRIGLVNLTLDGGLADQSRDHVPTGAGTVTVGGPLVAGLFTDTVRVSGGTCPIGHGDVLRAPGQPPIVVNDSTSLDVGSDGATYVCSWAPDISIGRGGTRWQVHRTGNLVTGIGRLVVDNCLLLNAKRHAIDLEATTQGNVANCEIGGHQGCGVFGWGATDFAISDTWFFGCGGPHVYLYQSVDVRLNNSLFEGSANANVYADRSELELDNCGLWGGRTALVHAHDAGMVRLGRLKLRQPGYGTSAADAFSSAGFRPLSGRPAIDVHFADEAKGLQAAQCTLHEANPDTGPIIRIANGSRSNLSGIEWDAGVTFAGGNTPGQIIVDRGASTIVRGCRSVPDKN